jgi:hypothetical protein
VSSWLVCRAWQQQVRSFGKKAKFVSGPATKWTMMKDSTGKHFLHKKRTTDWPSFAETKKGDQLLKESHKSEDYLLPTPPVSATGNFFNATDNIRFLQCNMVAVASIQGFEYGVGFPIDTPVAIIHLNGSKLTPVTEDSFPAFDDLFEYIQDKLDDSGIQLIRTPMVLTVSGEFEEDDWHEAYLPKKESAHDQQDTEDDAEEEDSLSFEDIVEYEDELLAEEGDDEDLEKLEEDTDSEEDESKVPIIHVIDGGKVAESTNDAEVSIFRPSQPDLSLVDPDAFVTEEDERNLQRAHKRADRILEYAADMKLMGSFQFKKQNFHLVRLLEPIMLFGKQIWDRKGYEFTLLDEKESQNIRPRLEKLLQESYINRAPDVQNMRKAKDNNHKKKQEYHKPVNIGSNQGIRAVSNNRGWRKHRPQVSNGNEGI